MPNPYVFVVGSPRSGTTLLRRLLNAHPLLAVTTETQWVTNFFKKRVGLTPDGLVTPALIDALARQRTFAMLRVGRRELEGLLAGGPVPYARFVSAVYDRYARARGKPLAGDKTPEYGRKIPLLHGLWPAARFVHLVRDGRDVCLSAVHWGRKRARLEELFPSWADDPVTTAAVWWERNVRQAREGGRALGPGLYYELRYEALVGRPAEECARLCAFLGLPYDGAMLRFHEGRTRAEPGLSAKSAWRPVTPGLRDWRAQLPAGDVERFEAAAGALLDELGYPRAFPRPGPEALAHAADVRARFTGACLARKSARP